MSNTRTSEAGFSLAELLVAMVMTIMVAGSVFGLLYAGQSSFQRNPELMELEQNLRMASDSVMTDISTAGVGMSSFVQTFTPGLDGLGPPPPGGGAGSDYLELFGNDGSCPDVPWDATLVHATQNTPGCLATATVPVLFYYPGTDPAVPNGSPGGAVWAVGNFGGSDPNKTFTPVRQAFAFSATTAGSGVGSFGLLNFARYEIANASAADPMPCLWRSARGGTTAAGAYIAAPDPTGGWQLVARGIENMQVLYKTEGGGWTADGNAPIVNGTGADLRTLISSVRVTLSGRSEGRRTLETAQPRIYRSQLSAVGVPRAALMAKQKVVFKFGTPPVPGSWR
jgi:type II secretory pathway pseudopilin PulG